MILLAAPGLDPAVKILVETLTSAPADLSFETDAGFWQLLSGSSSSLPQALERPFEVKVAAHQMGSDVYFEGGVIGSLSLECARCLARYGHVLDEPFRLVLEPAGDRVPPDPEAATALARDGICLGDEMETGWYRGNEIDLSNSVLEVVALALPVKPLCSEECRGLCPHCGVDLNDRPCKCSTLKSDSPFAALAKLRDGFDEDSPGGS